MNDEPRRVRVFLDYWWVYSSARQVFPGPETPSPAWFGNVAPAALAHLLVKRPPTSVRRSQRTPAGLDIFIRDYEPEVHRSQHERVLRWQGAGAEVHVGPSRAEGGGFWQSAVSVAIAGAVVAALERGDCDTAVVFAGDAALLPLFRQYADDPSRIELATWIAPDGTVPTALPAVPGIWSHRLGEATFRQVTDDRRVQRPGPPPLRANRPAAAAPASRPPAPGTAMAAAFVAAGLGANGARGHAGRRTPAGADTGALRQDVAAPPQSPPGVAVPAPLPAPSPPERSRSIEPDPADSSRVRRLTHRLFGREA